MTMQKKIRIDQLLVEKGLAESRSQAQRLIMAGQVRVNGQIVPKPSVKAFTDAIVNLESRPRFVSRGGEKLEAVFDAFNLTVDGQICADVGASTGGFTDCLLQHGAQRVFAIDVGQGILHWKLRNDPRIAVMEGTNARYVQSLPHPITFISIDVSFISLKVILPVAKGWLSEQSDFIEQDSKFPGCQIVALIKPQFEAGRKEAAKGKGVIRDPEIHQRVLSDILSFAQNDGFSIGGLIRSPIIGPKGNIEFLVWMLYTTNPSLSELEIDKLVSEVIGNE